MQSSSGDCCYKEVRTMDNAAKGYNYSDLPSKGMWHVLAQCADIYIYVYIYTNLYTYICIANLECNGIISFASLAHACHLAINTLPPCTYITRQGHELKDPCSLVISWHITWSHVHNACSCVVSLWRQVTYWTHATPMAYLHVSILNVSKWPFNHRAAIALPVSPSSTCDI